MPKFRFANGSERNVSKRDAKLLTLLKKGEVVEEAVAEEPSQKLSQDFDDKKVLDAHAPDKDSAPQKRAYRRKDMRAEG